MLNSTKIEDIIIIGSGPAAYTAALYTENYNPLLIEGLLIGTTGPGGQLTTTTDVDNYPGFPNGIQGPDLIANMQKQIKAVIVRETVTGIVREDFNTIEKTILGNEEFNKPVKIELEDIIKVKTNEIDEEKLNVTKTEKNSHGKKLIDNNFILTKKSTNNEVVYKVITVNNYYLTRSIIIATGAQARRLYVPGTHDNEYWQKGVSSCAVCDGWIYVDKPVVVIGGGDSAMEEALYLSSIASKVILVHRRSEFRARKDMLEKVRKNKKIVIMTPFILECVKGNEFLENVYLRNCKTKVLCKIEAEGLFFGIGHDPNTQFVGNIGVKLDEEKYIITDEDCKTGIEGVFACGDVQDKKYKQAVTAAASGCTAAFAATAYLSQNRKN